MLWWSLLVPAGALQQPVDRAGLCALADRVVVAVPVAIETVVVDSEADLPRLARRVSATVQTTWLGVSEPTVDLVLPGGRLGALEHRVEDVPDLTLATPWLLFLEADGDRFRVIGGAQGARRAVETRHAEGAAQPLGNPCAG